MKKKDNPTERELKRREYSRLWAAAHAPPKKVRRRSPLIKKDCEACGKGMTFPSYLRRKRFCSASCRRDGVRATLIASSPFQPGKPHIPPQPVQIDYAICKICKRLFTFVVSTRSDKCCSKECGKIYSFKAERLLGKRSDNRFSKYKGVSLRPKPTGGKPWIAWCGKKYAGIYAWETDAARAYDKFAEQFWPNACFRNFKTEKDYLTARNNEGLAHERSLTNAQSVAMKKSYYDHRK